MNRSSISPVLPLPAGPVIRVRGMVSTLRAHAVDGAGRDLTGAGRRRLADKMPRCARSSYRISTSDRREGATSCGCRRRGAPCSRSSSGPTGSSCSATSSSSAAHRPRDCLDAARPPLAEIGAAARDVPIVYVPGNHDHQLVAEWVERRGLGGDRAPLGLEEKLTPGGSGLMAEVAAAIGAPGLTFSYPGVWLRPDVYAIHGHYLDRHNRIPAVEVLAISIVGRVSGADRSGPRSPDGYEAAAAPVYAFDYSIAQSGGPSKGAVRAGSSLRMWRRLNPHDGRTTASRLVLGGVLIPGAVAAANRAGLGPFSADLTPATLRRAALDAITEVVSRLEVEAEHVIFGHTHRAGPLPDDAGSEGWAPPRARRACGTPGAGSTSRRSSARPRGAARTGPARAVVNDDGPPQLLNLLRDTPAAAFENSTDAAGSGHGIPG